MCVCYLVERHTKCGIWGSEAIDTRERPITVLTFTNVDEIQITLIVLRGIMSQLPDFDAHGGVDKPRLLYDSMVHLVVDVKFTLVSTHRSQETIKRKI